MTAVVCEHVQGFDVMVTAKSGFATVAGRFHSDQMDRDKLVSRIASLRREAARKEFGHFYAARLAACQRALELMGGAM